MTSLKALLTIISGHKLEVREQSSQQAGTSLDNTISSQHAGTSLDYTISSQQEGTSLDYTISSQQAGTSLDYTISSQQAGTSPEYTISSQQAGTSPDYTLSPCVVLLSIGTLFGTLNKHLRRGEDSPYTGNTQ